MYIVHITTEFAGIAKAGGLGDVVHGLSREQQKSGHHVEIIIPKYDIMSYQRVQNFSLYEAHLWSFEDFHRYHNSVYRGFVDDVPVFFMEPHHSEYYFNRGQIYGCANDVERFLYFSRASLEFLYTQNKRPDIIHIHDWPTAAVAPLMKNLYSEIGFSSPGIVFTIHNLEHQGRCPPKNLTRVGLRGEEYRTETRMQDQNDPTQINLMKGGIVYADKITTVSPRYSEEIQTPEGGAGLHDVITKNKHKLTGILNGIDLEIWNPKTNRHLFAPYSTNPSKIDLIVKQKGENKKGLFDLLGLSKPEGPLVTCITRLALQKGPWLIQSAIHHTLRKGGAFILLGSTMDDELRKEFLHLKLHYASHPHLYISLDFDEGLANQIYAASDMMLIPSLFEPCGLTQMIAMRFGSIPVARKTGGLSDTVFDLDDPNVKPEEKTGFTFFHPHEKDMQETLDRAFHTYHAHHDAWKFLIKNVMQKDFGWKKASDAYDTVYQNIFSVAE